MPLKNLKITNHFSDETVGDSVNQTNIAVDDGVGLPKAVKITISPIEEYSRALCNLNANSGLYPDFYCDEFGDTEGFETGEVETGYWSIRASDISISGYKPEVINNDFSNTGMEDPSGNSGISAIVPLKIRNTEWGFTYGGGTISTNAGGQGMVGYKYQEFPWYNDLPANSYNDHYKHYGYIKGDTLENYISTVGGGDAEGAGNAYCNLCEVDGVAPDYEALTSNPGFPTDTIADVLFVDSLGYLGPYSSSDAFRNASAKVGNEVQVYVVLKTSFTLNEEGSTALNIDFDGEPRWISTQESIDESFGNSGMMPAPIEIDVTLVGQDTITTSDNMEGLATEESTIDGGFARSSKKYNFNLPRIKKPGSQKITSITIKSEQGYYFNSAPKFTSEFKDDVKSVVRSKNRTNGKVTSYSLDLVYISRNRGAETSLISGELSYTRGRHKNLVTKIDKIYYGSDQLPQVDTNRKIKIYGTPGATIGLAINESFVDNHSDRYGDLTDTTVINHVNDVSILSNAVVNSTTNNNYGKEIPVVYKKINKRGYCSFNQVFPGSLVGHKSVASGKTATTFTLENRNGIQVGDRVYSSAIPTTTPVKVSSITPAGANDITLDTTVTLATNQRLIFKRARQFNIDIVTDLTSTLGRLIPQTVPTYKLQQYIDPVLTLKHSMTSDPFNINGGANGADYDLITVGKANANTNTLISVSLLLDLNNGAHNFATFNRNRFSLSSSGALDNGGTMVSVSNLKSTSLSAHTITVTYDLTVLRWGTKDVTMELVLCDGNTADDLLTYS